MENKQSLSSSEIQAKLRNLQQSAGRQANTGGSEQEIEITVASHREAFDLPACQRLLEKNEIPSRMSGTGFHQTLVVSREYSSQAIDLIAARRERLQLANPLSASDYVVGIVFWAFLCGLVVPGLGGLLLMISGAEVEVLVVVGVILLVVSAPAGGLIGYLRSRSMSRRKRVAGAASRG